MALCQNNGTIYMCFKKSVMTLNFFETTSISCILVFMDILVLPTINMSYLLQEIEGYGDNELHFHSLPVRAYLQCLHIEITSFYSGQVFRFDLDGIYMFVRRWTCIAYIILLFVLLKLKV